MCETICPLPCWWKCKEIWFEVIVGVLPNLAFSGKMVTYFFHNQILPGFLSTDDLCLGVLYRIKKDHTSHIVTKSFFFSIHFTGKHSCAPFLFNVSFSTPTFSNKLDEEGDIGGYNNEPSFGNTRGQITHGDCNHNFNGRGSKPAFGQATG